MRKLLRFLFAGMMTLPFKIMAQDAKERPVQTVFPFLLIAADARSAAMADAGVATSPDSYSAAYNSAKLPYVDAPYGAAISYSPWLSSFASRMNISQMNAYYRLTDKYVLGASF